MLYTTTDDEDGLNVSWTPGRPFYLHCATQNGVSRFPAKSERDGSAEAMGQRTWNDGVTTGEPIYTPRGASC